MTLADGVPTPLCAASVRRRLCSVAPELREITQRITRMCEHVRAGRAGRAGPLPCELEDALHDGYAHALAGDAWSMQVQTRMAELMRGAESPGGASGLPASSG